MQKPPENPVKNKDFQKVVERMLKTPPKPRALKKEKGRASKNLTRPKA